MRGFRVFLLGTTLAACTVAFAQTTTNHPPLVAIVAPTNGAVFNALDDIFVMAQASDRDSDVVEVSFFANQRYIGGVTNPPPDLSPLPPWRIHWNDVAPGSYSLQARATDKAGTTAWSSAIRIEVRDGVPPVLPRVNVVATDPEASESTIESFPNSGRFRFTRSGNTSNALTVHFTIGGTAQNEVDYHRLDDSIVIPAGREAAELAVLPLDDKIVEPRETVIVRIVNPICATVVPPPPGCYAAGENHTATVYIADAVNQPNEPPVVRINFPENGSRFPDGAGIRIHADAYDNSRYLDTVEFFANGTSLGIETNYPYTLQPYAGFSVIWSNAPAGEHRLTAVATDNFGLSATSAPVNILVGGDLPPPPTNNVVTIEASDSIAVEQSPFVDSIPNTATFVIHRGGPTNIALAVFYDIRGTASNGVDYTKLPGHVTIPAGTRNVEITIEAVDEFVREGTESVILTLLEPACIAIFPPPPECYQVGRPNTAIAYIRELESPPTNIPPAVRITAPQSGSAFPPGSDITVEVVASDPDGYVPMMELFANDRKIGEQVLNFIIAPPDGTPTHFSFVWSDVEAGSYVLAARGTDSGGATAFSDEVRITVSTNKPPPPPITTVTIETVDAIATEPHLLADVAMPDNARVRVRRHGETNLALAVFYQIGGTASEADYRRLPHEVIIPAGMRGVEFAIEALDDSLVEGTETLTFELRPPHCYPVFPPPPGCYQVGIPGRAELFIRDNDFAPSNQPPTVRITAPRNGDAFREGSDILIEATTVDPDGYAPMIEFYANGRKIGEQVIHFIQPPEDGSPIHFSLAWSNVTAGAYALTARATDDAGASRLSEPVFIRVTDDDPPPPPPTNVVVSIVATDAYASEGPWLREDGTVRGTNTATFAVRRAGPTNDAVTISYRIGGTASNGVDYVALPGVVTIPTGARGAQITVIPLQDTVIEKYETVVLELAPHSADTPSYIVGETRRAAAVIADNDYRPLCMRLPGGLYHLCRPATDGERLRVEASCNLVDWTPLSSVTVTDGAFHFVDADADGLPHRFYRLVPDTTAAEE
jgi:hypothetical protein